MMPRVGKRSTREGSSEAVRKGPLANSEPGALRSRKKAAERGYMGQHQHQHQPPPPIDFVFETNTPQEEM